MPDIEQQGARVELPALALETAFLASGLPRAHRVEALDRVGAAVRARGVTPAFAAVIDGRPSMGIGRDELLRLARGAGKAATRDLPTAAARGVNAGATVSATLFLAHKAGIAVAATGGIGGVHPGGSDVSADLIELARTPIILVCSGAKAIMDLPATLERLETLGVIVAGYGTNEFPAFWTASSGLRTPLQVSSIAEVADIWKAARALGTAGALLLCVPPPEADALGLGESRVAIEKAEAELAEAQVEGPDVTPFLLDRIAQHTDGRSVKANLALLENNAAIGAELARELQKDAGAAQNPL